MSVIDSVFKLEFTGTLNFFNITTVEVGGFVDSLGNFEFRGKIEIDIYLGPLHLNAGASLLLSSKPLAVLCLGPVTQFYDAPMLVQEGWAEPRPLSELLFENQWGTP